MPKHFRVMLAAALTMTLCAFGVFGLALLGSGYYTHARLVVLLGLLCFVFLSYLLVSVLMPGLHPTDRVQPPQNLTLPLVFDSLLLLLMTLVLRTGDELTRIPEPLRFLEAFVQRRPLAIAFVAQVIAMSVLALVSQTKPAPRVDSD